MGGELGLVLGTTVVGLVELGLRVKGVLLVLEVRVHGLWS